MIWSRWRRHTHTHTRVHILNRPSEWAEGPWCQAAEEPAPVDDIALFCLFALNDFRSAAQRVRRHIMLCLSIFKSFAFVLMLLTRKLCIGMNATKHRRKTKWPYAFEMSSAERSMANHKLFTANNHKFQIHLHCSILAFLRFLFICLFGVFMMSFSLRTSDLRCCFDFVEMALALALTETFQVTWFKYKKLLASQPNAVFVQWEAEESAVKSERNASRMRMAWNHQRS